MLRASRSALAAAKETTKLSTGITGLVVDPNWRQTLTQLYEKTLKDVQIMPEDIHYRQTVEATAKHRLQCIQSMGLAEIEDEFDQQVEEMIEVAKDELHLIPLYSSWRAWEAPEPTLDDEAHADLLEALKAHNPAAAAASREGDVRQPKANWQMAVETVADAEGRKAAAAEKAAAAAAADGEKR